MKLIIPKKKSVIQIFVMIGFLFLTLSCKKEIPPNTVVPPIENSIEEGQIYVCNEDGESLSIIDAKKDSVIKTISMKQYPGDMAMPHNVQVAPDGKSVWVTLVSMTSLEMDRLAVIDPSTYKVIKYIPVGRGYHLAHIVLDEESKNVFTTSFDKNIVIQFDATTYKEINRFKLDSNAGAHGMRYSHGKIYVANMLGKSFSIIDVKSGNIKTISLGGVAVQTAVTPDAKFVFISLYDTREVIKYNIENSQITRIALPSTAEGPIQIYPTPDGRFLLVADQGELNGRPVSNQLFFIDIAKETVTNTIIVGKGAHGVVASKLGKYAYVTNNRDNTVSKIQLSTLKLTQTISMGLTPSGISYRYNTGGMP